MSLYRGNTILECGGVPSNGVYFESGNPVDVSMEKIKYGIASVTFTNSVAIFNHNLGFSNANSYVLLWLFNDTRIIPLDVKNIDGNSTQICCRNFSGTALITNWSGTVNISYIAIGV